MIHRIIFQQTNIKHRPMDGHIHIRIDKQLISLWTRHKQEGNKDNSLHHRTHNPPPPPPPSSHTQQRCLNQWAWKLSIVHNYLTCP